MSHGLVRHDEVLVPERVGQLDRSDVLGLHHDPVRRRVLWLGHRLHTSVYESGGFRDRAARLPLAEVTGVGPGASDDVLLCLHRGTPGDAEPVLGRGPYESLPGGSASVLERRGGRWERVRSRSLLEDSLLLTRVTSWWEAAGGWLLARADGRFAVVDDDLAPLAGWFSEGEGVELQGLARTGADGHVYSLCSNAQRSTGCLSPGLEHRWRVDGLGGRLAVSRSSGLVALADGTGDSSHRAGELVLLDANSGAVVQRSRLAEDAFIACLCFSADDRWLYFATSRSSLWPDWLGGLLCRWDWRDDVLEVWRTRSNVAYPDHMADLGEGRVLLAGSHGPGPPLDLVEVP